MSLACFAANNSVSQRSFLLCARFEDFLALISRADGVAVSEGVERMSDVRFSYRLLLW
tara:strand:+ start:366 stop:539 length:174 start_codon:yes stop_codon:yes gene_type:complete